MPRRGVNVHLISDSTGETIELIGRACFCQFDGLKAQWRLWPFVNRPARLDQILAEIAQAPGIVLWSLLDRGLGHRLQKGCRMLNLPCIDVLGPVLNELAQHLQHPISNHPGRQHRLDADYFARVEAMQRAFLNETRRESDP